MAPEIKIGSMAEPTTPLPLTASRADQIFPRLTSAQIERVATHGRRRAVRSGEVLVEQAFAGEYDRPKGEPYARLDQHGR